MLMMRVLKPVLFIFECIRVLVLIIYVIFLPVDLSGLPRLVFIAPGVLFPIMAMFIWLDISRFNVYLPLFTAGKCISAFTLLCWSAASGTLSLQGLISGTGIRELAFLGSDLLALGVILLIHKNYKIFIEKHDNLEQTIMEEN